MNKKIDIDRFKSMDVILPQGARSRFAKAVDAMEAADDLVPDGALEGSSADINGAIVQLNRASANLQELLVYRKVLGVD